MASWTPSDSAAANADAHDCEDKSFATALDGPSLGATVGKTDGHAVLGRPVWAEPSAIDGYAVDGASVGVDC